MRRNHYKSPNVYSADVRSGYFSMKFNMDWFWVHLDDDRKVLLEIEPALINMSHSPMSEEDIKQAREEFILTKIEDAVSEAASHFIVDTVWKEEHSEHDNVWDAMFEAFLDCLKQFPGEIHLISQEEEIEPTNPS